MKLAAFITASLFPVFLTVLVWFATRKWKPLYKTSLLILTSILSFPLGWELVARVLGLDFTPPHSPGLGVAFMPLIGAWIIGLLLAILL